MTINIAIFFGGDSCEHRESIKSARILYEHIKPLFCKYKFYYFYITKKNKWANKEMSYKMITGQISKDSSYTDNFSSKYCDFDRVSDLKNIDMIYNTMMGTSGENGNIMGLADILQHKKIIGCDILASALSQDKHFSKLLVKDLGINIVDFLYVNKNDNLDNILCDIKKKIGYPCFVKPNNLGTCAYIFRANNESEFIENFKKAIHENKIGRAHV